MTDLVYLVELTAYDPAIPGTRVLRYCSGVGKVTSPTETPANVVYEPRVIEPTNFSRSAFSDARTMGGSTVGFGEIVLNNADQGLSALLDYGLDGRPAVVRVGPQDGAYPGDYTTFLSGTVEQVEIGARRATIRLRDRLAVLDQPIQATKYAGTNALPAGVEGTADDIKGQPKPQAYGRCYQVPLTIVNTARLICQFHDGSAQAVDAVRDMGLPLAFGTNRANLAALEANEPAPGAYDTCLSLGLLRLGAPPAGRLTADIRGDAAGGYVSTVGAILRRILEARAGIPIGEIDTASFTALDAAAGAEVGIYITGERTMQSVADELLPAVGAWLAPSRLGLWQVGRLVAPSGAPAATFTDAEIIDLERQATNDPGRGVPVWRVVLSWRRHWAELRDADIASSVAAATRAQMTAPVREVVETDAAVQTKHLLATQLARATLLTDASAAATEAARVLALHKARRDFVRATVRLADDTAAIDLGAIVRLVTPRLGYGAGRDFVVIGLTSTGQSRRLTLDLWG